MITVNETYGQHKYFDRKTFMFTMSTKGQSSTLYRPTRLTPKQKRAAIKEFRAYVKSGLRPHQWHDLTCKKCKGA